MVDETKAESEESGVPEAVFAKSSDQVRIRTERFRQVYANNMAVNFSTWDLGITFGEIAGEQDGKTLVEETVRVLLTREIAKVLSIILTNHIKLFEAKYGEIRLPVTAVGKVPAETESQGEPTS